MKLEAFAKINLTLDVCGRKPTGLHLLDSLMQSVSLGDTVTVERASEITVECSVPALRGDKNIAYLAALTFFRATDCRGGAAIQIEKRIPAAAGLGGGSADAAAVLRALDRLYGTALSESRLCEIGAAVGADVPFCLTGGTKRIRGTGERVIPAPPLPSCFFVLVKQGEKRSTADMYRMLDGRPVFRHPDTAGAIEALRAGDLRRLCRCIDNSFADVCGQEELCERLRRTKPLRVSVSGSGPTVFGIYPTWERAETAAKGLADAGISVWVAEPRTHGVLFE